MVKPTWLSWAPFLTCLVLPSSCEQDVSQECQGPVWGHQLLLPLASVGTPAPEERAEPMGSGALGAAGRKLGLPHFNSPAVCYPFLPFSFCPPEPLSNMVVNGVLQGLYGFGTSSATAQPEAPCHLAPLPLVP